MKVRFKNANFEISICESILVLAIISAASTIAIFLMTDWGSWVCATPASDPNKPLAQGAAACLEFWINRYQGLIGAISALIAAAIAWSGVQNQVRKADDQINVATKQFAIGALETLRIRRNSLTEIFDKLGEAASKANLAINVQVGATTRIKTMLNKYKASADSALIEMIRRQREGIDVADGNFELAHKLTLEAIGLAKKAHIENIVMKEISNEANQIFITISAFASEGQQCDFVLDALGTPEEDEAIDWWLRFVGENIFSYEHHRIVIPRKELRAARNRIGKLIDEAIQLYERPYSKGSSDS